MRIVVLAGILTALALPAAAQEPTERQGSIGASFFHLGGDDRRWPYSGIDGTYRIGEIELQGTYHRYSRRYEEETEYAWTRTLEWITGGVLVPVSPAPRWFKPHVLAGGWMFRELDSDFGKWDWGQPAVYGGLGAEFPLGWRRTFVRVQHMTVAVHSYGEVYVGHVGRVSVGIGF